MKIFFDTEFTGLRKDTTLISIGMIAENGKTFYAELTDYNTKLCDDWIEKNVIDHLYTRYREQLDEAPYIDNLHIGNKECIGKALKMWLKQFDDVQFVSDVCHYDMVLLIDLFGTAFDLPENVSAVCYDINQDIAKHYGISNKEAFDKSREEIVKELCGAEVVGEKHNSLYDAKVIKAIYDEIK